jgi:hypothetical protein
MSVMRLFHLHVTSFKYNEMGRMMQLDNQIMPTRGGESRKSFSCASGEQCK